MGKLLVSLLHGFYLHKHKHSDIRKINGKVEPVGERQQNIKKKNVMSAQSIYDNLVEST